MKHLTIRQALESDIQTIQHIGETSYREHFSHLWTPDGISQFLDADFATESLRITLSTPSKHLWLLAYEKDDRPVGFAKINWFSPDPIQGKEGAELQKIYFLKSCVSRGYGGELLSYIVACAKERSQAQIWLDVLKNNTGAQHFYQRSGFCPLGHIPFKTDIYDVGMIVMAQAIA